MEILSDREISNLSYISGRFRLAYEHCFHSPPRMVMCFQWVKNFFWMKITEATVEKGLYLGFQL